MRRILDAYEPPKSGNDPIPPWEDPSLHDAGWAEDLGLTLVLVLGYGAPLVLGAAALVGGVSARIAPELGLIFGACAAVGVVIALSVAFFRNVHGATHARRRQNAVRAAEVLILGILPVWGFLYSHFLGRSECEISSCTANDEVFRPFAEPEVYALIALHAITVLAYAISRRRPRALRPVAEVLVHATLMAGVAMQIVVGIHVGRWIPVGFLLAPVFMPCIAPILTVILYGAELRSRLRRRGKEAATPPAYVVVDSPFREGPVQAPLPAPERIHKGLLASAFAVTPALLGLYAVIHALWLGRADGAMTVFTRTCGHVLSRVPIVVLPEDCHYLCTVAARGHGWLVRPERVGRRGGVPILVNRQLALANAFEDLLHERWPRFGRFARRVYDRVGLPVSRYIQRRWLADLTYLAMKPAEWLFAVALLLLDRGDPEDRIDRMYR